MTSEQKSQMQPSPSVLRNTSEHSQLIKIARAEVSSIRRSSFHYFTGIASPIAGPVNTLRNYRIMCGNFGLILLNADHRDKVTMDTHTTWRITVSVIACVPTRASLIPLRAPSLAPLPCTHRS